MTKRYKVEVRFLAMGSVEVEADNKADARVKAMHERNWLDSTLDESSKEPEWADTAEEVQS